MAYRRLWSIILIGVVMVSALGFYWLCALVGGAARLVSHFVWLPALVFLLELPVIKFENPYLNG